MSQRNLSQPTINHIYIPSAHPAGYSAASYSANQAKAPQVIFNPYGQEPHEEKKKKKEPKKRHSISSKNSSSLSKSSKSTNESLTKTPKSSGGKEGKSLEKVRSKSRLNDDFDTRSERKARKSFADDFDTRSERKSRRSMAIDDFDTLSVSSKRSKKKDKTVSVRSSSIPAPPTSKVTPNEDEDVPLSQKKQEFNRLSSRSQETLARNSSLKLGRPSDLNLYDRKRESSSSTTFVGKEEPVVEKEKKKGLFTRLFNCFKSSDNLKKKPKEELTMVKTPSNTSYRSLDPNSALDPKADFRSRLDPKSSTVTLTDRGAPSKYEFDLPQISSAKPYQPISTAKTQEPLEFGLELDDIMSKYFDSTKVTRPQRRNTQSKNDKLNYSVDVDPELFEFRGFL